MQNAEVRSQTAAVRLIRHSHFVEAERVGYSESEVRLQKPEIKTADRYPRGSFVIRHSPLAL
ncbi:hypothetical protein JXB37_08025, partial [candidate division WOR-3 bacterium]|nr:hypothetical protein [candidate division WOR-3 bacterium]